MAKIVNICLYGPVTDGWSYQDNLLPKYQKINGNEVTIITSKWIYDSNGEMVLNDKSNYVNENGIKIVRLDIKKGKPLSYKFKRYVGLIESLEHENPDILFIHGFQYLDIYQIVKYIKNKNIKVFVDNHCDFSNSATTWLSKNVLHKIIWRQTAKAIEPYTEKFWGVIPARVDFIHNMYGIPMSKIDLLVMGVDDEVSNAVCISENIWNIKKKYNIKNDDFVIVTGGKIDKAKYQTLYLMKAFKKIKEVNNSVRLIIFGSVEQGLKKEFDSLLSMDNNITYVGFVASAESMLLLKCADLVVFPGRHSVYWEETVGLGIPMVVKYWDGTTHVDVGGNVEFLRKDTEEEIVSVLSGIVGDLPKYQRMKQVAVEKGMQLFSYKNIAKRSIQAE